MLKLILLTTLLFNFKTVFSQNTYAFFGSFNRDKTTEGIYAYELDTLSGEMNKVSSIKNISNPSFLTISPNGNFISLMEINIFRIIFS
jgi:6-phosphogluconolactonase